MFEYFTFVCIHLLSSSHQVCHTCCLLCCPCSMWPSTLWLQCLPILVHLMICCNPSTVAAAIHYCCILNGNWQQHYDLYVSCVALYCKYHNALICHFTLLSTSSLILCRLILLGLCWDIDGESVCEYARPALHACILLWSTFNVLWSVF